MSYLRPSMWALFSTSGRVAAVAVALAFSSASLAAPVDTGDTAADSGGESSPPADTGNLDCPQVDGYYDCDSDGFGRNRDCDDADADVNPNAVEICTDFLDNDCDGFANDGCNDEAQRSTLLGGSSCNNNNSSAAIGVFLMLPMLLARRARRA